MQAVGVERQGTQRRVDEGGVRALDEAVACAAGLDRVLHSIDPRRLNRFADGGPAVWSVALCPCADGGYLFVTYGLSQHVDPDAPFNHEMSLRVPATHDGQPPEWPRRLLSRIARRQLTQRAFEVNELVALRRPLVEGEPTAMRGFTVATEPAISDVRRVVGLHRNELALAEVWSAEGLLAEIARRDPYLCTDVTRSSYDGDPTFVEAMEAGARREGSSTHCINVAGFGWRPNPNGFSIDVPGGSGLRRVAKMIRARLDHQRELVIQDVGRQVRFYPHGETVSDATSDVRLEIGCDRLDLLLFAIEAAACEPEPSPVTLRFTKL